MSKKQINKRRVEIYRYDPTRKGEAYFDHFDLEIEDETNTTILDVLIRIQKEQDPSLAFRYACRVNMCGSCGMVINGREGLACKTNVSDFADKEILTIRPLNHFPVIKDLVVDMTSFFEKYEDCLPFFEPGEIMEEPAVIRPDSRERRAIGLATECIACGCCVSSCTMANYHDSYAGPAPLNRAFTLLMDSRDALYEPRMDRVLQSCYNCRTEFNCTEVCPKEISCTRAIKYIQRLAIKEPFRKTSRPVLDVEPEGLSPPEATVAAVEDQDISRRNFLTAVTLGIGGISALSVGGVLAATFVGPAMRKKPARWLPAGSVDSFPIGEVSTIHLRYEDQNAFYRQEIVTPVMIWRQPNENEMVVYSATCTHLGCTVRWDTPKRIFLCACHGGAFELDGTVKAGPPPRPLDRLAFRTDSGNLLVKIA